MYSLDCKYYQKKFNTVTELLEDVVSSGMDPIMRLRAMVDLPESKR